MLVDAVYQQEDYQFYCPVLAPGGLLFCLHYPLHPHPTEPTATFQWTCCFDHKLLATYRYWTEESAGTQKKWRCGLLALQGL